MPEKALRPNVCHNGSSPQIDGGIGRLIIVQHIFFNSEEWTVVWGLTAGNNSAKNTFLPSIIHSNNRPNLYDWLIAEEHCELQIEGNVYEICIHIMCWTYGLFLLSSMVRYSTLLYPTMSISTIKGTKEVVRTVPLQKIPAVSHILHQPCVSQCVFFFFFMPMLVGYSSSVLFNCGVSAAVQQSF